MELQYVVLAKDSGHENLTKDSENDEKDLTDLEIVDNSDLIISKKEISDLNEQNVAGFIQSKPKAVSRKEKRQEAQILNSKTENLASVLIESDGKAEPVKYHVDLNWKLQELVQNIKNKLDLDPKSEKRLLRLPGNSAFFEEELELNLRQLSFNDGVVRLKVENGKFPQFGKLAIKVINQSKFRKQDSKTEGDIICTPNELTSELYLSLLKLAHKFLIN